MKAMRTALILGFLLVLSTALFAATRYGDAIIEKGAMNVVREGRTLRYDTPNEEIEIIENDLIRVKADSRVRLRSREKAEVNLGSNAIFHVKPWQSKGKTGFLRALFGKFRASIVGLTGGEQFNVKTATATIGVKGTEYQTQVTNRGTTLLIVRENVVGLQGQRGAEVDIGENLVSITIGINAPTPPVPTPPQVQQAHGPQSLDAPPPNSPQGGSIAGEKGLIQAGIVTEEDLEEGKGEGGEEGEFFKFIPPREGFEAKAARDAAGRAFVKPSFQTP